MVTTHETLNFSSPCELWMGDGVSLAFPWELWVQNRPVVLVSDERVMGLHGEKMLQTLFSVSKKLGTHLLKEGDENKTFEGVSSLFSYLLKEKFGKDVILIALGGGQVSDTVGFVAANYQRGVDYFSIPTTLLSQVDAGLGGKTAINFLGYKNMIGVFYHAKGILMDTLYLQTESQDSFFSGLGEVIKYYLLNPKVLAPFLGNPDAILKREQNTMSHLVCSCARLKASFVLQDERETKGIRTLLNLGHTFAHGIEKLVAENQSTVSKIYHGKAVAMGLYLAAHFSHQHRTLSLKDFQKVQTTLARFSLASKEMIASLQLPLKPWIEAIARDKKHEKGQLHLVLLNAIGEAYVDNKVSQKELEGFLKTYTKD